MKDLIVKNWKIFASVVFLLVVCLFTYLIYNNFRNIPIGQMQNTSVNSITDAQKAIGVYTSEENAKQISNAIQARIVKPADTSYTTQTQKEADTKANTIAKKDSADYILKETKENTNSGNIQNNYYGVHLEKKNAIGAGVTVTDGQVYFSVAYERQLSEEKNISAEVIAHTKNFKEINGATVLVKKKF